MVEMTEVAIATMSEYMSLSASSATGYTIFKASITGCARFFNSKATRPFKSSATMSPVENGPTIWKRVQTASTSLLTKSRAYATVDNQRLLPRAKSNLTNDETRGEDIVTIRGLAVFLGTASLL